MGNAADRIAYQLPNVSTINFKRNQPLSDLIDCDLFQDVSTVFGISFHAEKTTGVTQEILANVWRIDNATAKRTINFTTQLASRDINTSLSRYFGMNNRMLRYRRIASFFHIDCLFVMKNKGRGRQ